MRPMRPVLSWEPEPEGCGLGWVARLFGKTQDWVKANAEAGVIPGRKANGQWQFDPMEIREWFLKS